MQSLLTAGFHAKNWLSEMPVWLAIFVHVMPLVTRAHLLQFTGEPGMVGPGGVGLVVVAGFVVVVGVGADEPATPTQYASPSQ